MGNGASCPVGFTPSGGLLSCAVICPANKGFENRSVGSEARCVYTRDPAKFVVLRTAPMVINSSRVPTLEWLQVKRPGEYTIYKQAQDDASSKIAILLANIARDQQITDAFQDLQSAENARDQAPEAYQTARNRYYTLLRGDAWEAQERTRVLTAEVLPQIAPYTESIRVASERQTQQATTKSAVDAVKTNLMSLKDDFRTTTTTLSKQVTELRNQIELQKRRALEVKAETSQWSLNLVLVALAGVVIFLLSRRLLRGAASSPLARPTTLSSSPQTAGRRR